MNIPGSSISSFVDGVLGLLFIFVMPTQLISGVCNKLFKRDQEKKEKIKIGLTKSTIIVSAIVTFAFIFGPAPVIEEKGLFYVVWTDICLVIFFGATTQLISGALKRRKISRQAKRNIQPRPQNIQPQPQNTYAASRDFDHMDIAEFDLFCGSILQKNGFTGVSVVRAEGDAGIDVIAFKNGIKYGIQCKCASSHVGMTAVQKALAGKSYFECRVAVVLTNHFFSSAARELAEKEDVLLWGRDKLIHLVDFSNGISP